MRLFRNAFAIASLALVALTSQAIAQDFQRDVWVNGTIRASGGHTTPGGNNLLANNNHSCFVPAQVSTAGTDATPVATTFYYSQATLQGNVNATGVAVFNGTVASGNIKVGIANAAGVILATSASTAMSGTDAYQLIPFTQPVLLPGPANYFILEFIDNNTARVNMHTLAGTCVTGTVTTQVFATGFTNFTPATTFTTAVGPIASLY